MRVWLFNHDAVSPDQPGGTRHYDFAKALNARGHDVTIFASSFHYILREETRSYGAEPFLVEEVGGVRFVWFKTRPYHGNSFARVINMLDYLWKVLRFVPKVDLPVPDVIVGSSVHLFAVYGAHRLARRFGVPFVMEVRDIWPQTLIDLGFSKWHPFILLLAFMEKFLYRRALRIISLLPKAGEHIMRFGIPADRIIWIPNGVDLSRYEPEKTQVDADKFILAYGGAVGDANALDTMIETAKLMRDDGRFEFKILGDGPSRAGLMELAGKYGLENVEFVDPVPKNQVAAFLRQASVLYFNLKDCDVFRFGISSNKLFDYLASGRPVIFSSRSANNPVEEAGAGPTIAPGKPKILADTLRSLAAMAPEERRAFGEKGRAYVDENYNVAKLIDRFEDLLNEIQTLPKD